MIIFNYHYALFPKSECGKLATEGVYKNPQLVAQHCFVASFSRCFPFFINLSHTKFARTLANQPTRALHFFNPQQVFSAADQDDQLN